MLLRGGDHNQAGRQPAGGFAELLLQRLAALAHVGRQRLDDGLQALQQRQGAAAAVVRSWAGPSGPVVGGGDGVRAK